MVALHAEHPLAPYAERELLNRYHAADADTIRRGRCWYAAARAECRALAVEFNRPLSQVAAVLAITSPDAQLSSNLRWTREILAGERQAGRYPTDQAPKVAAALTSSRPGQYVSGPKVSAFYRAIMGDGEVLVIDRWAAYCGGGSRDGAPRAKARKALELAYRAASAKVGETVRDFQVIVWIQARETTAVDHVGRGTAIVRKLADITA